MGSLFKLFQIPTPYGTRKPQNNKAHDGGDGSITFDNTNKDHFIAGAFLFCTLRKPAYWPKNTHKKLNNDKFLTWKENTNKSQVRLSIMFFCPRDIERPQNVRVARSLISQNSIYWLNVSQKGAEL